MYVCHFQVKAVMETGVWLKTQRKLEEARKFFINGIKSCEEAIITSPQAMQAVTSVHARMLVELSHLLKQVNS